MTYAPANGSSNKVASENGSIFVVRREWSVIRDRLYGLSAKAPFFSAKASGVTTGVATPIS